MILYLEIKVYAIEKIQWVGTHVSSVSSLSDNFLSLKASSLDHVFSWMSTPFIGVGDKN